MQAPLSGLRRWLSRVFVATGQVIFACTDGFHHPFSRPDQLQGGDGRRVQSTGGAKGGGKACKQFVFAGQVAKVRRRWRGLWCVLSVARPLQAAE
jgi:hypothetical protein